MTKIITPIILIATISFQVYQYKLIKNLEKDTEIIASSCVKLFTTQENVNNKTSKAIKLNADNISELTSILGKGK